MRNFERVLLGLVFCFVLLACQKNNVAENKTANDLPLDTSDVSIAEVNVSNQFNTIESLSFDDMMNTKWDFVVSIIPYGIEEDPDLGEIIQDEGKWTAYYGSGFARTTLISMSEVDPSTVRFTVDIAKNPDPEEPFVELPPDTPVFRFYVDLSEEEYRQAVQKGISENRKVVVILLTARDEEGKTVKKGQWFKDASVRVK